jgi:hypothetical protein
VAVKGGGSVLFEKRTKNFLLMLSRFWGWACGGGGEPRDWPGDLSRATLTRYAKRYLRRSGWEMLPEWDYDDVRVRASKDGMELNLFVVDDSLARIGTVLRDIGEKGGGRGVVVGALTQQPVAAALRHEAEMSGLFVVNPAELPEVDKAIRRAVRRREQRRSAALALD